MSGAAGALLRAARMARPGRGRLALSLAMGAAAVAAGIGLLATSGYLISRAALEPAILTLTGAIVAVRSFAIARAASRYAERLLSHDVALRALARMRRRVYDRLIPLVPGGIPSMRGGDVLSRAVADVEAMQDLYVRALGPPAVAAAVCALAAAVAWAMLAAAGIALAVLLALSALVLVAMAGLGGLRAGRRQAPAREALTAEVLEALRFAPDLAAYGLEDDRVRRVREADRALARTARSDAAVGASGAGLLAALAGLGAALMLVVGAPAVAAGELDGVLLAALALLALAAVEALAPLPAAARSLSATATAARRIEEITERPPPARDPQSPLPVPARPALALAGARLRYSPDRPWVLDGVELRLDPGRRVAVVGPSGSGKTTIANVLVRFRDLDAGRATLDGEDLARYAQGDVRRSVRLCEQDAYLFATSLRDNVRIGRPDADDVAIRAALARVGLADWLGALPDGLETQVGEAGARVSGGQRSRVALARALLSQAPVLVLDEPAAHLDPISTRAFIDDLVTGAGDASILLITHSPIGLERFDEVLVLDGGRMVAAGRHADLLSTSERYRSLMGLVSSSISPA